jgi:hypothetical protein
MAALGDVALCEEARAEIRRRVDSNAATRLAVRFLLPPSESDREDAFDGLVGLCFKARRNLAILPSYSEINQGMTWRECTRDFVEVFLLDYFECFQGQSETAILRAALEDRFRYIGRRLWSRLRDEIRMGTARTRQEPWAASLSERSEPRIRLENLLPTTDSHSTLSRTVEPRFENGSTPLEFVRAREAALTDALGERNYEALEALTEVFPERYEDTNQAFKSAVTRAIEQKRGISPQAARQSKRDLCERASAGVRSGNRDLNDLHRLVAHGEDENTLRLEFTSRDGRRKKIVRRHVKFDRR